MKEKFLSNLAILAIFSLFFIVGIIVFDDYGISWDEYYHRINGFVSLNVVREYFSFDTVYPHLVHTTKSFADTAKIYGVIFDLPMAFIESTFRIENSKNYFLMRHLFNFLIFYTACIFFYLTLRKRFKKSLCIIGLLFLLLTPRIFAESFYNMKDLIFLSFFIISVYFAINFINNLTYKNASISALTCSLLISSKVIGIIVPFIVIVFFLSEMMERKKFFKKDIAKIILFLFLLIIFTVIFWPYLWNDPLFNFLNAIKTFSAHPWHGGIFYLGNYISALNLPWHYAPIWIIITVPIIYLILFFLGSILIFIKISFRFINLSNKKGSSDIWKGNNEKLDLIFFLIFYFTLFLVIELNTTLYNGWRHLYFIYPCLIFISIRGLEYLFEIFLPKYLLILIYIFLLNNAYWMFKNHPYQYVYFNKFAGDYPSKFFELDYWGTSNKDTLEFIADFDKESIIKIYDFSNSPYYLSLQLMDKIDRQRFEFVKNVSNADYLVTNHYYQENNPNILNNELKKKYKLIKEFKVDKLIINSIYKIN